MIKQEVIILHGLPASGKTTWAKDYVQSNQEYKRLCRDDIRMMLDNYSHDYKVEMSITKIITASLRSLLKDNLSVILDATHMRPKYIKEIKDIVESIGKEITIAIKDFPIDKEEALLRDAKRERPVGEIVIERMWQQRKSNSIIKLNAILLKEPISKYKAYVPNTQLHPAIIVDIDGTIAHRVNRGPYELDKVGEDEHDIILHRLLEALDLHYNIIYMSGRNSRCHIETAKWLLEHSFPDGQLFMRKEDDNRKDAIVKYEIFDKFIRDNYYVEFVLDDRNQVVEMWREIGLKCLQVQPGDF